MIKTAIIISFTFRCYGTLKIIENHNFPDNNDLFAIFIVFEYLWAVLYIFVTREYYLIFFKTFQPLLHTITGMWGKRIKNSNNFYCAWPYFHLKSSIAGNPAFLCNKYRHSLKKEFYFSLYQLYVAFNRIKFSFNVFHSNVLVPILQL